MQSERGRWAELLQRLGLEHDQAVAILKRNGIDSYDPEEFDRYKGLLAMHNARIAALQEKAKEIGRTAIPELCPICGSGVEADPGRDGMYHSSGWRCMSGEAHFSMSHWDKLRDFMVVGKSTADNEVDNERRA